MKISQFIGYQHQEAARRAAPTIHGRANETKPLRRLSVRRSAYSIHSLKFIHPCLLPRVVTKGDGKAAGCSGLPRREIFFQEDEG